MCRCIVEIVIPDNVTRITEDDKLKIPHVKYEWMTKAMIEYTDYRGEGRKFILYEVEVFSKYLKMEETVMLTEDTATFQINVDDKSEKIKDVLERLGRPEIEVNKVEALIPTVDLSDNELYSAVKFALTWL